MVLLVDELRRAFYAFVSSGKPTASIFDDQNISHFVLNDNVYEGTTLIYFYAVIILITLEQLYYRTQTIPENKRAIYKDFSRPYKEFIEQVNQDKLKGDIMLDLVFTITQPEYYTTNLQEETVQATGTLHIDSFITATYKDYYVDKNDWEQELAQRYVQRPVVLRYIEVLPALQKGQSYVTVNNYDILEYFQTDTSGQVVKRLSELNEHVYSTFNYEIKDKITRYNKQVYVDPHFIYTIASKRVFQEYFFQLINGGSSLQPVIRLSKFRHGCYYCLIPSTKNNFINENNLMRFLLTGEYVQLNYISVFEDYWAALRRKRPVNDSIEVKSQRNHLSYSGRAEIVFCTIESLMEESAVKSKGLHKFLIDEGRLLAIFCAENVGDVATDLDAKELSRLIKEYKINCFQFTSNPLDALEGSNHFVLGKGTDSDEEVCYRIWALLGKRLQL